MFWRKNNKIDESKIRDIVREEIKLDCWKKYVRSLNKDSVIIYRGNRYRVDNAQHLCGGGCIITAKYYDHTITRTLDLSKVDIDFYIDS